MTISSTTNRVIITGNGITVDIPFPYSVGTPETDLVVIATVIATGAQTIKAFTTHWTWAGSADASGHYPDGGTVTALVAPPSTETWTVYRDPTADQGLDLVANDDLPAEATEFQFDYLTMLIQRVKDQINRTLQQPEGDVATISRLPAKVERASMFLAFDANGDPIAAVGTTSDFQPVSAFIGTLLDDVDAATARATLLAAKAGAVTASDLTMSSARLLGRTTAATGAIEELTVSASLTLSAGALAGTPATTSQAGVSELATQAEVDAMTDTTRILTPNHNRGILATPQASTSGVEKDFTSIPAGVRRITIMFSGVSGNGTSNVMVQIGDAGGIEATGYLGTVGNGASATAFTTGFGVTQAMDAASILHGAMILTLLNDSTNTWVSTSNISNSTGGTSHPGAGAKSLSAVLDRIRITTVDGTDAFDAGAVNILYER